MGVVTYMHAGVCGGRHRPLRGGPWGVSDSSGQGGVVWRRPAVACPVSMRFVTPSTMVTCVHSGTTCSRSVVGGRRGIACKAEGAGGSSAPSGSSTAIAGSIRQAVQHQLSKLDGLWSQLIPMTCLFFMLAFVNTIIDSLKDSLVITAVGGGTEVLPYLSTYAVLPSSILFLVLYSWATRNMSREKIFNVVVGCFLVFYGGFAALYPYHEVMHSSPFADWLLSTLPNGFAGFVGMVRNWMFTAFYCVSELWGDILLSLLFWGLANETTSIEDAPLLYPLFGIGANIAQTCAGRSLRLIGDVSGSWLTYSQQIQLTVAMCVVMGVAIAVVHTHIVRTFEKNPKGSAVDRKRRREAKEAREAKERAVGATGGGKVRLDAEASVPGLNYCDVTEKGKTFAAENGTLAGSSQELKSSSTSTPSTSSLPAGKDTSGMSIMSAWKYLIKSPQIKCLAVMAIAQGLTTRILEVSWKTYLHMLCPSPVEYAAFLGDVAAMTGVSTALLMVFSPLLFDLMGWVGVASATPNIMLIGGIPFFIACIVYSFGSGMLGGVLSLKTLVLAGAVLHIFARGAKFSLFKPSEEMVYIGLDDESRTKGKAAIDVVGAQSGKSLSSILQQFLLIFVSGGSVSGIIPVLGLCFATMLGQWKRSIRELAEHGDPAHAHRMSVMASIDDDEDVSSVPVQSLQS